MFTCLTDRDREILVIPGRSVASCGGATAAGADGAGSSAASCLHTNEPWPSDVLLGSLLISRQRRSYRTDISGM